MNFVNHRSLVNLAAKEAATLRDVELVRSAKAGSSTAFAELQRFYSRPLFNTIMGITKNTEDAEDALQDSFLRAFVSLGAFEGRSSFYSWLTRIGINSALMILRRRRNRAEVPFEFPSEMPGECPQFDIRDSSLNPEQICDQRQRCAYVVQAIQRLDPSLRVAIQLQMTRDWSLKEIAQTLRITEAAVKARLYRARQRLSAKACRNNKAQRQIASPAA
jgi:RNA polymerase sigma-70 factor (ECF subfamily)